MGVCVAHPWLLLLLLLMGKVGGTPDPALPCSFRNNQAAGARKSYMNMETSSVRCPHCPPHL